MPVDKQQKIQQVIKSVYVSLTSIDASSQAVQNMCNYVSFTSIGVSGHGAQIYNPVFHQLADNREPNLDFVFS